VNGNNPVLKLEASDYALTVAPDIGGSIRSFTWRGVLLMRTARDNSVLDAACLISDVLSSR
jgi:aldose 1-epimerase